MSVGVMSKSLLLSSSNITNDKEDLLRLIEKQGIVSILGSDNNEKAGSSLRRTLSADMSSKKWLAENGMKKIVSSQNITMTTIDSSSCSSDEEDDDVDEYGQQVKENAMAYPRQSDIWSKIMSQKVAIDNAPAYVPSLVRRSTSSLSEKSLKICTESLGSETGSDVFSSYPPSEASAKEEKNLDSKLVCKEEEEEDEFEEVVNKYNYSTTTTIKKKVTTTRGLSSFPPPLPSLARGGGGDEPSLHMHSHRQNGRLVLEAITTVPSQNFFQAQRQNGRLFLTLVNNTNPPPVDDDDELEQLLLDISDTTEEEKVEEEVEEEEEEEEEEDEDEDEEMFETNYNMYRSAPKLESEVINVHRSAIMLKSKKLQIEMANKNTTWPNNVVVDYQDWEEKHITTKSLPPPTSSFNSYEYFWRGPKPTVASVINIPIASSGGPQTLPPLKNNTNKQLGAYMQKDLVLLRGNKADSLLPLLRGCKNPTRSLLFWEPHCIATS